MRKVGLFLDRNTVYLGYLGAAMGVVSLIIMMLMITLGVILRYFFNNPLTFVDEYGGYLLVVMVYMGLAYTMRAEAHINVDFVIRRLPRRARGSLEVVGGLLGLIIIGIYFWYCWNLFVSSLQAHWMSMSGRTPLWVPHIFLVIGLPLFGLELAVRTVKKSIGLQKESRKRGTEALERSGDSLC